MGGPIEPTGCGPVPLASGSPHACLRSPSPGGYGPFAPTMRIVQMQVVRVETGELTQALEIRNGERLALERDQTVVAELLEHAVDVHGRDPERVAQFILGQGEVEAGPIRQADALQSHEQLAEQVGHL